MICPKCETDNLDGKKLCYKCGAHLLQAPGAVTKKKGRREQEKKGFLTGFLVIALMGIGVSVALWTNRERVAQFFLEREVQAVLSAISEEVDKEAAMKVAAQVKEAWEREEFDVEKLEKARSELSKYIADGKLDKEETDKLMKMFREAIGVEELKPAPEEQVLTAEEREEIRRKKEKRRAASWLQVGYNFIRVGMYDLAIEFYQKVIDEHPESQEAQKAREMIKEVRARLESKE